MSLLEVDGLHRPGLAQVSFSLAAGECLAVRGPSGAGKTLLLRALADLDPSGGRVTLDGVPREAIPGPRWRGMVGYVPAEPGWWGPLAADHFEDWRNIEDAAREVGLPEGIGARPVAQLSTGERQRLALLRALERLPRVLLLDEPTAALDGASRDAVEAMLARRRRDGLALVWVTHDPGQAARVAARVLEVAGGAAREVLP